MVWKGEITKVAVDVVKETDVDELVSASGKIQPEIEVKLSSEVSGEVVELNIKEGDFVKKDKYSVGSNPISYSPAMIAL
ncbi:efflux RND transporter periplasmic adaptor subunit [Sphingobacterium sp. E70]|uniref:efflux RND transporter periplasmic adaptor subunit n=1 Tax=Sphingobacterium sp. E70 TaxID=2853439 RepID=UPI002795695A|nr:efflux RND transporter periplasmic adaptor subunit [Sphingobacterium sp. E70]